MAAPDSSVIADVGAMLAASRRGAFAQAAAWFN
jgi:hypothetical protein